VKVLTIVIVFTYTNAKVQNIKQFCSCFVLLVNRVVRKVFGPERDQVVCSLAYYVIYRSCHGACSAYGTDKTCM